MLGKALASSPGHFVIYSSCLVLKYCIAQAIVRVAFLAPRTTQTIHGLLSHLRYTIFQAHLHVDKK